VTYYHDWIFDIEPKVLKPAPTITDWDNELPTLIMHGVNDECGSGLINMIIEILEKTGQNSGKTIFADCIVES
jgi:hypothetical protein